MDFEYNSEKSRANLEKHGIDFEDAQALWQDEERFELRSRHQVELRHLMLGSIGGKHWTAVFTRRGDAVRIISVRRSRKSEREFYEKNKRRRI